MKYVVLKKIRKYEEKVFTKKKGKDIIKKNYNPLKVNYKKIYKRGSGLYKMKDVVLESKNKLNLKIFVKERMSKNINLFSEEELAIIKNNTTLIEKVYLLGLLDNI